MLLRTQDDLIALGCEPSHAARILGRVEATADLFHIVQAPTTCEAPAESSPSVGATSSAQIPSLEFQTLARPGRAGHTPRGRAKAKPSKATTDLASSASTTALQAVAPSQTQVSPRGLALWLKDRGFNESVFEALEEHGIVLLQDLMELSTADFEARDVGAPSRVDFWRPCVKWTTGGPRVLHTSLDVLPCLLLFSQATRTPVGGSRWRRGAAQCTIGRGRARRRSCRASPQWPDACQTSPTFRMAGPRRCCRRASRSRAVSPKSTRISAVAACSCSCLGASDATRLAPPHCDLLPVAHSPRPVGLTSKCPRGRFQ